MTNSHLFNPNDPTFIRNPYPVYRELHTTHPIFYDDPSQMWLFARHEDVASMLRNRRFFGRSILHLVDRAELDLPPENPDHDSFSNLGRHSMMDKEPPEHTRLRGLVHLAFTPKRVRELQDRIQQIANDLIDATLKQGMMEVLEDFAVPLSVTVIAELLGIPQEDRHHLRPWSSAIVKMYELDHTDDQAQLAVKASSEFADYLRHLANTRVQEPQDDLITALALVEAENGDRLTEDELISTCVLLLNAGHEATVNVVANGLLALFHDRPSFDFFKSNLSIMPTAIEEIMRYDTPLQLFKRWVLEDIDYKGIDLKQGMEIGLLYGAANHDASVFDHPEQLNLIRDPNPHISFGGGVHYCLGAPLARVELTIAFNTLLTRLPNMELAEEPQYQPSFVIRGLKSLNIRF